MILAFGLNASHSPADQASQNLLRRYTHDTITSIALGIAALVAGTLTAFTAR